MKTNKHTTKIIDNFREAPRDHEFYMLKGLLLATHALEFGSPEHKKLTSIINGVQIAERMDELNNEAREKAMKEIRQLTTR